MTSSKFLATVSLATLLALSACSFSGDSQGTGGDKLVFDFTDPTMNSASSIEFRIPDELIGLSDGYAENRVHESVTVSGVDSEDSSLCAVEYRFNYADDGLDSLLKYVEDKVSDSNGTVEESMANILTGEPLESIELGEDYSFAVVPLECADSPTDSQNTVSVSFSRIIRTGTPAFARAEITAMQGGDLFIQESDVEDWQLDTNGNWIR